MSRVKWGEYKLGDLFYVKTTKSIDKNKITFSRDGDYDFIGRSNIDNGVQGKVNYLGYAPNAKDTFSLVQVGETICLFRNNEWYASQNIFILSPKITYLSRQFLFTTATINKALYEYRSAYVYPTLEEVKRIKVEFPQTGNGEIDFNFMEEFVAELEARRVAELEAYLLATGLKDYTLTEEEEKIIKDYKDGDIALSQCLFKDIFNNIKQGRRLKKDDQQEGDIPFVMSGVTNTGVVGYIANPVAVFPKNSITIDIFGNAFYRDYNFGAGDDTGVYWNDNVNYSKQEMLFFTASMEKSLSGKYSYGKKLRSSQSYDFKMYVIDKNGKPDYKTMKLFISAIQKLVIRDVVLYADSKIAATKSILNYHSK